jgi:hypothetical protein
MRERKPKPYRAAIVFQVENVARSANNPSKVGHDAGNVVEGIWKGGHRLTNTVLQEARPERCNART